MADASKVVPLDAAAHVQVDAQANAPTKNSDAPSKERRMSAIVKDDSYFEIDTDAAPSFYQSVMTVVTPSQLAAAVLAMFVLQLVIVIIALGLGQYASGIFFAIGCGLCTWSIMALIWREDEHLAIFKPGTPSFWAAAVLLTSLDATFYALRQLWSVPVNPDVMLTCGMPFSPGYIVAELGRKVLINVVLVMTIMYQGHKDKSPHLYRLVAFQMIIAGTIQALQVGSGQKWGCFLVEKMLTYIYLGGVIIGIPLVIFKVSGSSFCDP